MPRLKPLLFLLLFHTLFSTSSQNNNGFCEKLNALKDVVQQEHYNPKTIDDNLSSHVFNLFLARIDSDNRLYLESDISEFESDRFSLDDFIKNGTCGFIDKYVKRLNRRIEESKSYISDLKFVKLDYSGTDTIRFRGQEKLPNFKDKSVAKTYWDKRIRYDVVSAMIESDSSLAYISQNFNDLEREIKPKVINRELCRLEELRHKKGSLENFVKESFLNAYLLYHDPNSIYFNSSEKAVYENRLSNNQLSFGITTTKNDDGDIIIAHITPGSPAFKNSTIEENDIITALISDEKVLEAYCVSNNDIIAFTNDEKLQTLTFRVKKPDGAVREVKLSKEQTKTEQNTITGYILKGKTPTGYININSFYTDFESANGLGVANDVAKELSKLEEQNIEGLIIDLRFNGGGSMKEAADLTGMFIDKGPLSILKYNNGQTFTIKDMKRGLVFKKPIVILVNNYSASASEFFSAAMQDYHRALIVGSPTHGKASAQVILPLEKTNDIGFTKLTVEKFYRVTGKSHQSQGVIPDIVLPGLYDNFETEERFSPFALSNDIVPTSMGYQKMNSFDIENVKEKSKRRIDFNPRFQAVKALNKLIINNYFNRNISYTLTLENVYNEMHSYRDEWMRLDAMMNGQPTGLIVTNTSATQNLIGQSNEKQQINSRYIKDINSDIYIKEANNILKDLLEQANASD